MTVAAAVAANASRRLLASLTGHLLYPLAGYGICETVRVSEGGGGVGTEALT